MGEARDLFADAADRLRAARAPLAARVRPRTLDEVAGQRHLVGPGAPLRVLIEADALGSAILWGPAGTGKTTLAQVIAASTAKAFVPLSAVSAGVKEVREELAGAVRRLGERGQGTIVFVDEVHRFSKAQQDVLLPGVEDGTIVLVGATTENPYFSVNAPLLSRSTLWRLEPLGDEDLAEVAARGLAAEGVTAEPEALALAVASAEGDARSVLVTVEIAAGLARRRVARQEDQAPGGEPVEIEVDDVRAARGGRLFHQGVDEHYDQISAFIKSVRGSDADAGLFWLARMLEAGEDPRFLARRLVILASEDVGMADPAALPLAVAAAQAVELVGLPEAALNLAEAVVYLARAPKSNRVTVALGRAQKDVRRGPRAEVPRHLRDAHYQGAAALGHGEGYRYPHSDPGAAGQRYRPEGFGARYYEAESDNNWGAGQEEP